MRNLFVVAVLGMMVVGAFGCQDGKMHMPWDKKTATTQDTMKMSEMDDCPMCPGVQHADANGKCPKCGMKVKG